MDRLREMLDRLRDQGTATGRFRSLLHLLIGRRITLADGTLVSEGMTWRSAAAALKKYRWDREAVRELGLDPKELPPRDREKYWYAAVSKANLGAEAIDDAFVQAVREMGYEVGA